LPLAHGPDTAIDDALAVERTETPAPGESHRIRTAYLVSEYPRLSHEFIAREVAALRDAGAEVLTFTVRPVPPGDGRTASFAAERLATPALLGSKRRLATAALAAVLRNPAAVGAGLGVALRSGPRTLRGRVWQVCYLIEALLLVRLMRGHGLRHVHVHFANNGADIARLAATVGSVIEGRRWTWSLAMHGPTEFLEVRGFDLAAKVRSASFVACISDYCRAQLMSVVEPEHWSKLHLVRMTVDPERYPSATVEREGRSGPLRVLFVGRLVPEKGPLVLLDAVSRLPRGSVELRITGSGPLADQLATRIEELDLTGTVKLTGPLGQDELPAQYGWADVFCLPSFAEGLPVVLMEAMATGLPVLSTRITGIPELVEDGVTGLLVTPGRADLVAGALRRLTDPDLRRELGRQAARRVQEDHLPAANAGRLGRLLEPMTDDRSRVDLTRPVRKDHP
jgi:glycosyltransferase involved in cell wall biosynthesis